MFLIRNWMVLTGAMIVVCSAIAVWADDEAIDDSPTTEPTDSQPVVVEAKLETFYVPDKDGNMVPFFKTFPFEKLEQLYRLQKRFEQPEKPDRFSVPRLVANARQHEQSLHIDFSIQVRTHSNDWVRAPLRLGQCALLENPKITGPGEYYLNVSQDGAGYDLWAKAPESSVITVELRTLAPLAIRGSTYAIELSAPTAASSQLNFTPTGGAVDLLRVQGGVTSGSKQKTIQFIGLGGEFLAEFSQRVSQPAKALPPLIESSASITALFEGSHHIRSDAELRMHSLSGPLDTFLIRMPTGMTWVPRESPTGRSLYTISALTKAEVEALKLPARFQQAKLVRVQLARKTTEPVDVELRAVIDREDSPPSSLVEVAGFEVVGAAQQWGNIDLAVEGQWSVETKAKNVQRLDQIPAKVRQAGVTQRFEFSNQPCSLKVGVQARQPRISAEPAYTLSVEQGLVTLDAQFTYNIRGASEVKIDMPGWTILSVRPDSAVEVDQLNLALTSPLSIPLTALTQQEMRNLQISVMATAPIKDGGFSFSLPRPQATTVTPALVTINPASDILMMLDDEKVTGLTAEPIASPASPSQNNSLIYRTRGQAAAATLVGTVELRPRRVSVTQDATINLSAGEVRVQQQFMVNIEHKPLTELEFEAPSQVLESGDLALTYNDQDIQWRIIEPDSPNESVDKVKVVVDLMGQRRGAFPVVASWRTDFAQSKIQEDKASDLKLRMIRLSASITDRDDGARVTVFTDPSLRISDIAGDWSIIEGANVFAASHNQSPTSLELAVVQSKSLGISNMVVTRAWLQSWVSGGLRRNRAVYQVKTARDSLRIRIPEDYLPSTLRVAINGVRINSLPPAGANELQLSLQPFSQSEHQTVEVWYTVDDAAFRWGLITVRPPQIEGATAPQRFYWQLATPAKSQLIFSPTKMNDEIGWQWRRYYFRRTAVLTQGQLEEWSGATNQVDLPISANVYLFGTFDNPQQLSARVINRWIMAAIVAIVALVVVVAIFRIPILRRPEVLIAVAVCIAALAFASPAIAIMLGQWTIWGIFAYVIAQTIDWVLLRRRRPKKVAVSARATESSSGEAGAQSQEIAFDYSTATAPHYEQTPKSTNE